MSTSSIVSLGALRIQAQQRSDMQNNPAISTQEWNAYISQSYKELYDILVGAYGNDYYVKTPFQFTINGSNLYPLPSDHYKLLGVDLQYSASPTGWVTLKRFEFIDRNKASYLNTAITVSSTAQMWYIPEPTNLLFMPTVSITSGSTMVTTTDTSILSAGMSITGDNIPQGATVVSITNGTAFVISAAALATQPIVTVQVWTDAVTVDGIAGWEEYVVIDAAIKAQIKQDNPIDGLVMQKASMLKRIEAMAEGRDAGQAVHVSDALSVNGYIWGLSSVGLANIRYHLLGNQLQLATVSDDDSSGYGYGYGGGY